MIFSRKLYLGLGAMFMMGRVLHVAAATRASNTRCGPSSDASGSDPPTPKDFPDKNSEPMKPEPVAAACDTSDECDEPSLSFKRSRKYGTCHGRGARKQEARAPVEVQQWQQFLPKPQAGTIQYEYEELREQIKAAHHVDPATRYHFKDLKKKRDIEQIEESRRLKDYYRKVCSCANRDSYKLHLSGAMLRSKPNARDMALNTVKIEISPAFRSDGPREHFYFKVRIVEGGEDPRFGMLVSTKTEQQRIKFPDLPPMCQFEYEISLRTENDFSKSDAVQSIKFWLFKKGQHQLGVDNGISIQMKDVYLKMKNDAEKYHKSAAGAERRRLYSLVRRLDTCSD